MLVSEDVLLLCVVRAGAKTAMRKLEPAKLAEVQLPRVENWTKEIWGLWRGAECLACLRRKDGEEGHQVDDGRSWLNWEDRGWKGLG